MKNIQKLLVVFVISIFIVPQISLATGWNPFSGKVFNKSKKIDNQTVKIQQLENKIKELEKKVDSKNTVVNKTTLTTVQAKKQIIEKTVEPIIPVTTTIINSSLGCNGKYWNQCLPGRGLFCPQSGDPICYQTGETLEYEGLLEADKNNFKTTIVANAFGETRYYTKINGSWVQDSKITVKNTLPDYRQQCIDRVTTMMKLQSNMGSFDNQIDNLRDSMGRIQVCNGVTTEDRLIHAIEDLRGEIRK